MYIREARETSGLQNKTNSIFFFFRWRKKTFEYFSSLGIPGPEPNIIWGNLREYHQNVRLVLK